ncbi:hypothetical protein V5O48_007781 [Marasmius crinis-equi]|uniref:AroM protein n=1 Tax=Marasmius crinis-equi TaxID=585013 RepID=A0ABR3FFT4_9AGAR
MPILGLITIGQSPRVDLTPELKSWIPGVEIVERGALDGLEKTEIEEKFSPREGEIVLTSRLRDGSSVVMGHDHILPILQEAITSLEIGGSSREDPNVIHPPCDVILMACTGSFPKFSHRKPLLIPEDMMTLGLAALANTVALSTDSEDGTHQGVVGVLVPLPEQRNFADPNGKFKILTSMGKRLVVGDASPYPMGDPSREAFDQVEAGLVKAGRDLRTQGAQLIFADCMGYSSWMRRVLESASGVPVVLGRSIVARLTAELMDDGGNWTRPA